MTEPAEPLCTEEIDDVSGCTHESWSGVNQTPLDDPAKVWRCDACGQIEDDI